jgi:hypothetical protein
MPKIEDPQNKIFEYARHMEQDPEEYGKKIAQISRQEGYEFIKDCLNTLDDLAELGENKKLYTIVTLLRQPEWVWKQSTEAENLYYFGIKGENAKFHIRGYLSDPEASKRFYNLYTASYGQPTTECKDEYTTPPPSAKTFIKCLKQHGKYCIIEAGNMLDLLHKGYDLSRVILTKGKGYLKRFQAYAKRTEPDKTSTGAWDKYSKETNTNTK